VVAFEDLRATTVPTESTEEPDAEVVPESNQGGIPLGYYSSLPSAFWQHQCHGFRDIDRLNLLI
jgi:hypothetical protein